MSPDDFLESEVAVAIAAAAVLFSPRVRQVIRFGATHGLAGLLSVGQALTSVARDFAPQGQAGIPNAGELQDIVARPDPGRAADTPGASQGARPERGSGAS